jgi:hypothetical protein
MPKNNLRKIPQINNINNHRRDLQKKGPGSTDIIIDMCKTKNIFSGLVSKNRINPNLQLKNEV